MDSFDKFQHFPDCSCTSCIDDPSQARPGIHPFPDRLHVITMLENPLRWRSRYANYWKFAHHVEMAGAVLYTCEVAFGERHFEVTDPNNPRHLQLRTSHEFWHKENAQNLMLQRVPTTAKNIAFVDSDFNFVRTDWAQETLHLLQHYAALQMYSHLTDVDVDGMPLHSAVSMAYLRATEMSPPPHLPSAQSEEAYGYGKSGWGCPGGAWAYRREALDQLGGLIDWIIVGSADYYMAKALYGEIEDVLKPAYSQPYKQFARHWQDRALKHIKKNIGFMPGGVTHLWHGPKRKRGYQFRPAFLEVTQFNPQSDIKRDWQGLWQLDPDRQELRDGLRKYNRMRDEDSNEL